MSGDEYVEVEAAWRWHTDRALLVADADGREHWIPFTLINRASIDPPLDETVSYDTHITFAMYEWKAKQIGLI